MLDLNHVFEEEKKDTFHIGIKEEKDRVKKVEKKHTLPFAYRQSVGHLRDIHKFIIKEDTPYLWDDVIEYKVSDLESIPTKFTKNKSDLLTEDEKKITFADGSTLEDYFHGKRMRKQRNRDKEYLKNLLYEEVERDKMELPNPYQKGLAKAKEERKVLSEKARENRFVKKDESNFLVKYNKLNTYEKNIMNTLGVSKQGLLKLVSPESLLTQEEKEKLLLLGANKRHAKRKGARTGYIRIGDLTPLYFIDLVKVASTKNICYATGLNFYNAEQQLKRLERFGLVQNLVVFNSPGVWCLTQTGRAMIGSQRKLPRKSQAGLSALSERIYVNNVVAYLYSGSINILQEDTFPSYNRIDVHGEKVKGEFIVPESDIAQSRGWVRYNLLGGTKERGYRRERFKGESEKMIREKWEGTWRRWEIDGRKSPSPEFIDGNEWLYCLYYDAPFTKNFILPDIVVRRQRDKDGSPNSIAIEVERTQKKFEEYVSKLSMYKADTRLYKKVVYITDSKEIAKIIPLAAAKINFTRFDVVPMINNKGKVKKGLSGWEI